MRVTGADGTTYQGEGGGLALAMRDLGRTHRAGEPAAEPLGEAYLAGLRDGTAAAGAGEGVGS